MADQEHPMSLRPAGSETSPPLRSPSPSQQFQSYPTGQQSENSNLVNSSSKQGQQSSNIFASHGNIQALNSQMPSMPFPQSGQQATYSGRFPSSQFPVSSGQPESSSTAQQSNGYGESRQQRSRASTIGQPQSLPVGQAISMPGSPPPVPDSTQPLFAQHSGVSAVSHPGNVRSNQSQPLPATQPAFHTGSSSRNQSASTTRPSSSQIATASATKSPFTTPFTSPPRIRPNQLLVVNPTSTALLTATLIDTLRPILPHALEVTAYTASHPCPTAIDSTTDVLLSSESCLRELARYSTNNGETIQNFDAILVCNYGKHPLIDALRECYDVPVAGIMEASLYVARMLGARFGIITPSVRAKTNIDDAVTSYGLSHFFVGADSLNVSALDLAELTAPSAANANVSSQTPSHAHSKSREELNKRITYVSRALVAKGADTIILGSEFLCSNEHIRIVKDAVRDEDGRRTVNVIDPVEAGVMMLNGLIGMGVPTSKKGVYRSERDGRRVRGQGWL